jgi:DNA repair protein RecN (Recombination protein N)
MLASLRIKNLALVEELTWTLEPGFTAVTGETGAGKSVIIGALGLALGERADRGAIRGGAESCSVEAVFQLRPALVKGTLDPLLEENGVEPCMDNELIIRRTLSAEGTNRQFLNGSPTTLAVLKKVGDYLIDLHGPHDHQSLLSADLQLRLLDSFARLDAPRAEFAAAFRQTQKIRAELEELRESEADNSREIELLRHQVDEIGAAEIRLEEEEEIESRYRLASNSQRLVELASGALQRLEEAEDAVLSQLAETARLLRELETLDPGAATLAAGHANAVIELEEVAHGLRRYSEGLELDPQQLRALEDRITLFETLKRKYGGTLPAVLAHGERAADRLAHIENRESRLAELEAALAAAEDGLRVLGAHLTKAREAAAPKLAEVIAGQLRDLGFKQAGFELRLNPLDTPKAAGFETVEFQFAPNPGEPPRPLRLIASSGEISRVMLAVKSALAAVDEIPLLVFDEIDANVGGEIAHAVAAKMALLGESRQVLVITHLPQVAARAARQFVVSKNVTDGRTLSQLTQVDGEGRVTEIARMLGGQNQSSRALAETLLG